MQKKYTIMLSFVIIMAPISHYLSAKNALTFKMTGRLGDNIMTYCQHKWLAYNYNLDLYVPDFKFKEFFGLSVTEKNYSRTEWHRRKKSLNNETDLIPSTNHCFYRSSFDMRLSEVPNHDELGDFLFRKSIENPKYGTEIQRALALRNIACSIALPKDKITVAIHIRKGCDFDYPLFSKQYEPDDHNLPQDKIYSDQHHCIKFPPEQFYAEQLEKLYAYLGEQPLYVQIFSDATSPEEIVARMQNYLENRCNITFVTAKSDFLQHTSITTDIYAMSKFDYLIRSESHFPWISQMIGNHKGIIRPVAFEWKENYLHITRTLLDIPDRTQHQVTTLDF